MYYSVPYYKKGETVSIHHIGKIASMFLKNNTFTIIIMSQRCNSNEQLFSLQKILEEAEESISSSPLLLQALEGGLQNEKQQ